MKKKPTRTVHGDDLLYRFFSSLIEDRPELAIEVLTRMYTSMGIWFPREVYHQLPVLLPWVVRDPSCRGNKKKGVPDQWGAPNQVGLFRDDNSLVKALPRSLSVNAAAMPHLHGARMGTDFVAAHIWRVGSSGDLVSRNPLLNSFVPNLVWLPAQVAKLTDREGSVMQVVLQAMAWNRYRNATVQDHLRGIVEEAWSQLPKPNILLAPEAIFNEFDTSDRFVNARREKINSVIDALEKIEKGEELLAKVVSTRYTQGLPLVSAEYRDQLLTFIRPFVKGF